MAPTSPGGLVFLAHVLAFGLAALACLASLPRARRFPEPDTRRGLIGLVATSGGWAASHLGYLLAPTPGVALAFYYLGLVVGLAAVGAWLYVCSAYTGRTLHRQPRYRRLALVVYLALIGVKLTNPLHGAYFATEMAATPFAHLAIEHHALHWVTMGLAYALAAIGYFMLFELFTQIDYDSRALAGLVAVTGLPVALDILGTATPLLLEVTYEPLGVAVFAVGALFVYHERFRTIQFASDIDAPVIFVDEDGHIREANRRARQLFPALADAVTEPLEAAVPELADALTRPEPLVERETDGETRYYLVGRSPFTAGDTQLGHLLVLTDVTDTERHQRELERETDRLEEFASVVAHDLRNPLSVAKGYAEVIRDRHDNDAAEAIEESLARMETIIEDLLTLAREGRDIGDTEPLSLAAVVEACWTNIDAPEATVTVEDDLTVVADETRLQQLLENLFRNAVEHGGEGVTIRVGQLDAGDGFYVADDGAGIPQEADDQLFETGYTTAADGTGFGLAIVRAIVDAHGWDITAGESNHGGARFDIRTTADTHP